MNMVGWFDSWMFYQLAYLFHSIGNVGQGHGARVRERETENECIEHERDALQVFFCCCLVTSHEKCSERTHLMAALLVLLTESPQLVVEIEALVTLALVLLVELGDEEVLLLFRLRR